MTENKMTHDSLISVGCSLMYGSDHSGTSGNTRPSDQAYTNLVAKHYDLTHYNFAYPGTSNQHIGKQVFVATKFAQENNLKPIFWLAWTKYTHLGLTHMASTNISHNWPHVDVQNELINSSHNKDIQKWSKGVYRSLDRFSRFMLSVNTIMQTNLMLEKEGFEAINTFNSETWKTACKKSTYYIKDLREPKESLLDDWLETKKTSISAKHIRNGVMAGVSGERFESFDPYVSELWSYMKSFKWHEWGDANLGFQLWARNNGFPCYKDFHSSIIDNPSFWHPGEEAHQAASEMIINSKIIENL